MLKFFFRTGSLLFISSNIACANTLPPCPNGAHLTGGYAPSAWPTCPSIFSSLFIDCMSQGKPEEQCREEMQAAADAKDRHSECLWEVICTNKSPGSNKVVTKNERMNAETVCQ